MRLNVSVWWTVGRRAARVLGALSRMGIMHMKPEHHASCIMHHASCSGIMHMKPERWLRELHGETAVNRLLHLLLAFLEGL